MVLRNNQNMSVDIFGNIHKRKCLLILKALKPCTSPEAILQKYSLSLQLLLS